MINELAEQIRKNNKEKGFKDCDYSVAERIALIHSELSEALEADRVGKYTSTHINQVNFMGHNDSLFQEIFKGSFKDTFEDELADAIIRILDLSASKGIDIESHIRAKIRYNKLRPSKHGKKY